MSGEEQTTSATSLPSRQELFDRAGAAMAAAREQVSEAEAWLRADWRPAGSALSDQQTAARAQLVQLCTEIRARMDQASQVATAAAESDTDES